jgi:uncharacterized protein YkwD
MGRLLGIVVVGLCLFAAPAQALPHAHITAAPAAQTQDTTAAFQFVATATTLLAHFECRVDGAPWTTCGSPARYPSLTPGDHTFQVRLLGLTADFAPDVRHWTILPSPPGSGQAGITALLPGLLPPSPCTNADAGPSEVTGGRLANAFLCLLANERRSRGLPALRERGALTRSASAHALDMLQNRFFGHKSTAGETLGGRVRAAGYLVGARHWAVGEALHWGSGERSSPRAALKEMLASPAHRKIVLSRRLRDIGVAAVTYTLAGSGKAAATYVVNMGRRS